MRACAASESGESGARARPDSISPRRSMTHFAGAGFDLCEGRVDERVEVVVQPLGALVVACCEGVVELGDRPRREVADAAQVAAAAQAEHRVAEQLDARRAR